MPLFALNQGPAAFSCLNRSYPHGQEEKGQGLQIAMAGRPSAYSDEVIDKICERLIHGETLYDICRDPAMPAYRTVFDWLDRHDDFRIRCARARELQAEFMDYKILETAENCTKDDAFAAKVKIAAYQWRAMKLAPKKYGDRLEVEQKTTVRTVSDSPEEAAEARDSWISQHGTGALNGKANGKINGNGHA